MPAMFMRIAGTVAIVLTDNSAESGDANFQLGVDLMKTVHALALIDGDPEAGEHANQQRRQPQLQPPTNGMRPQAMAAGCFVTQRNNPAHGGL